MGTGQKHLLGNQLPLALFARRSTLIEVKAELVGIVWKIIAKPGDAVIEDQPLLIIESMKMEIEVVAPRAGIVAEIKVKETDNVIEVWGSKITSRTSVMRLCGC